MLYDAHNNLIEKNLHQHKRFSIQASDDFKSNEVSAMYKDAIRG